MVVKNEETKHIHQTSSHLKSRAKHEKQTYNKGLDRTRFDSFFEHANKCVSMQKLGELLKRYMTVANNKIVLEIGSTAWTGLIDFKKVCPEKLTCINISEKELEKGIKRAKDLGCYDNIEFKIMDAHDLDFPDNSVDVIYGSGVLHHLAFEQAIKGFHRVLKSKGTAIFVEPLRCNPFAKLLRLLTPNTRTLDERPLGLSEIRFLARYFDTKNTYFQLFAVPSGVISRFFCQNPVNIITLVADKIDFFIERFLPFIRPFFRYIVIYCQKK